MKSDYVEKTKERSLGMKNSQCSVVCRVDKRSASTNIAMVRLNDSFLLLVAEKLGFSDKNNNP